MFSKLPEYICPSGMKWQGIVSPSNTDKANVLGIYYNILKPQEWDAKVRKNFYSWISNLDYLHFPIKDEDLGFCSPSACLTIANKAFYGQLAKQLRQRLKSESFEIALENSLKYLEKSVAPIYRKMGEMFYEKEAQQTIPSLKIRFRILAESFEACGKQPKQSLEYAIQKYRAVQNNPTKLNALLIGSIEKSEGQELRILDQWEYRKISLMQMIRDTLDQYSNVPFFLALQEVTPISLEDLKREFIDKNVNWISFNNVSGKKTALISFASETVPGEAGSHTATIGLSPELKVQKIKLGFLPTCSGVPRTILGLEVLNINTGKSFAIFSAQTDYMIQDNLYEKNAETLNQFIKEFINEKSLPFIFGGDLNAFEGMQGAEYINNLRIQPMLAQTSDYREGAFFCPMEVKEATFLGHERDDYKMFFDQEGSVQPNALDHIFLTPKKILGFRKAGVYDESSILVDPVKDPGKFKENLHRRNTASDHFMNGVLFVSP